jgi:hypothetical protein
MGDGGPDVTSAEKGDGERARWTVIHRFSPSEIFLVDRSLSHRRATRSTRVILHGFSRVTVCRPAR